MNNYKVSILVPCFNGEEYLKRCLDSCLNQTYQNIEVILLNDGSTDATQDIANSYLEKSKKLKIYFQENKGLSKSRNVLIEKMSGDYGHFVDADDWLDLDYIEKLVSSLNSENDLVINSVFLNSGNKQKVFYITNKIGKTTNQEKYLINNTPFAWLLLFKKKFLTENQFSFCEKSNFFEDAGVLSFWIWKSKNPIFLNLPGYHYFINKKSLSRQSCMSFNKIKSAIIQLENFYSLINSEFNNKYPKAINDQLAFYHCIVFSYIQFQSKVTPSEKKELKKELKNFEKQNHKIKYPSRYWKFWYFFLYRLFLY